VSNDSGSAESPAKQVKLRREKISQKTIDELNKRHERIVLMAVDIAKEAIELGELLQRVKARVAYGQWTGFVERNLRFSMRTVQRYMKAAELKHNAVLDPAAFMAQIWGNEPTKLKDRNDVDVASDDASAEEDDDEEDDEDKGQHGGEALNFFSDKGKPAMAHFKDVVAALEREFFSSDGFTTQAKRAFAEELIRWLQEKIAQLK
jgi:hypothetical protein